MWSSFAIPVLYTLKKGAVCLKNRSIAKSFTQIPCISLQKFNRLVLHFVAHFFTVGDPVAQVDMRQG
jgi:hypothetical protein